MSSHDACDHPATKAARAACRRARDAGMRGVRNYRRDAARRRESAPAASESEPKSRLVGTRVVTREQLSPGMWVRIRAYKGRARYLSGYVVSTSREIHVKLDGQDKLVVFAWGEREIREEVWEYEDDCNSRVRRRHHFRERG